MHSATFQMVLIEAVRQYMQWPLWVWPVIVVAVVIESVIAGDPS